MGGGENALFVYVCVKCSYRGLGPILILIELLPFCFSHGCSRSQCEDPSLAALHSATATQTAKAERQREMAREESGALPPDC